MTALISPQTTDVQQRREADPILPGEDFDCSTGEECFFCACPETD
ncbi:MAG: hypothetical protein QOH40_1295 [Arthrobacter pascens]|nr:hypothetical protein [Arthrobacter pascens]